MPKPHGDILVNNFINSSKIDNDLFVLNVDLKLKKDIENISYGIFSPLKGFVSEEDFYSILKRGRLSNDLPWTIPIMLDVDNDLAKKIKDEKEVALQYNGNIFGVLQVKGLFSFDKLKSAKLIFQTDDPSHPGVYNYLTMKDTLVEGDIKILDTIDKTDKFRLTPSLVREEINSHGWKSVVAFQTRNVPHVAHEMLQKAVLNIYDGLFINPLIGKKKTGDFKDEVILKSYQSLINNYYHTFAAYDIFKEYSDLGIEPIFVTACYYFKKCSNFANERICPHDSNFKEELSGTKMRKMFLSGLLPPAHLMRTEISQIISSYKNPFVE